MFIDLIRLESLEKYAQKGVPHVLSYYDITLITEGSGSFQLNGKAFTLTPGLILFSSPGQVRYWDIETMPQGFVIIFEESFLNTFLNNPQFIRELKYFQANRSEPSLLLTDDETTYLVDLCKTIEREIDAYNEFNKQILRALLLQALVWLNRKYAAVFPQQESAEYNRHVQQFVTLVESHFQQEHSPSFYAYNLNITPGHLNDLCQRYLCKSAKQCIQERVFQEAERLVRYTSMSIDEIASSLNFNDTSYFVKRFKSLTGKTPLTLRKEKQP